MINYLLLSDLILIVIQVFDRFKHDIEIIILSRNE